MERTMKLTLLVAACVLAGAGTAQAAGFNIYEAGARATALGGAFTATADDGSAIFYNPAGLAFLEDSRMDLNLMPIVPGNKFSGSVPPSPGFESQTTDQIFLIPGTYFTHTTPAGLGLGIGIYAPFGLGVEWEEPETWVGRLSSYDVDLATIYVTPAVAYRFTDNFAFSIGADVAWQRIELNKYTGIYFGGEGDIANVIDTTLKGDSKLNVTPCAGLLYKPTPKLSVGVMYHHKKTMEYDDGEATLTNVAPAALRPTVDAQIAALGGSEHTVATELNLPSIVSFAAAYRIHPKAQLEFDAVRFGWGDFRDLRLDFGNPLLDQAILEKYEDVWQVRWGLDVDVDPQWKLMFGYIHDNTPQPVASMGPLLPDADREDFSLGAQYDAGKWRLTVSYMAVFFHSRSNVRNGQVVVFDELLDQVDDADPLDPVDIATLESGTYDSFASIFGLGFGLSF